jgi:hypothetical protein
MITTWVSPETGAELYRADIRLYNVEELGEMLAEAGLRLETAYGTFSGEPFEQDHTQLIVLATKS